MNFPLYFYFICDSNGTVFDAIAQDFKQLFQSRIQFDILYIVTTDIEQFADGFLVISLAARPLQNNESGKHDCGAAYCYVITETLKFISEIQQGLGGTEKYLDRPAAPICADVLTVGQGAVRCENDYILLFLLRFLT